MLLIFLFRHFDVLSEILASILLWLNNPHFIQQPEFNCNVTFYGGCKEYLKLKIKRLNDQPYSVTKCFKACQSTIKCGGFSIGLEENNSCNLYVDGCTKNANGPFTFFSLNDCKGDTNDQHTRTLSHHHRGSM